MDLSWRKPFTDETLLPVFLQPPFPLSSFSLLPSMTPPVTRSASQSQIPRGPVSNPSGGGTAGPSRSLEDAADAGQIFQGSGASGDPSRQGSARNALEVLANGQASTMAFLDRLSVRLQILEESSRRPGQKDSSRNHRPGPQDDTDCVRPGEELLFSLTLPKTPKTSSSPLGFEIEDLKQF